MGRLAWNFAFENVGRTIFSRHGSDNIAFMKMTILYTSLFILWQVKISVTVWRSKYPILDIWNVPTIQDLNIQTHYLFYKEPVSYLALSPK